MMPLFEEKNLIPSLHHHFCHVSIINTGYVPHRQRLKKNERDMNIPTARPTGLQGHLPMKELLQMALRAKDLQIVVYARCWNYFVWQSVN